MGLTRIYLTIRPDIRRVVDSDEEYGRVGPDGRPRVVGGEDVVLCCHFVEPAGTDYEIDVLDVFEASFDSDHIHEDQEGALTAGHTGMVTEITADGFSSEPDATGQLILKNGDDEWEAVNYESYTEVGGVYTFVPVGGSVVLTYSYLENDSCDVANKLMAYANDDNVDIAGDWADINRAKGKISIRLQCLEAFWTKIGDSQTLAAFLGIKKWSTGISTPSQMLNDDAWAENPVKKYEGSPASSDPAWTAWDARYEKIISGVQETLTDNAQTDVDIYAIATASGAMVYATISDAAGNRRIYDILITDDGTLAIVAERYGTTAVDPVDPGSLSITADLSGGNARINITLAGVGENLSMVYRITQIAINI